MRRDNKNLLDEIIKNALNRNITLANVVKIYLKKHTITDLYALLQQYIDRDGFELYRRLQENLLVKNPVNYFYAEECMGRFEDLCGGKILEWAELAQFGELFYKYEGPYEILDKKKSYINKETAQYKQYYKEKEKVMLEICLEWNFPYEYYLKTNNRVEVDIDYENDQLYYFTAADYKHFVTSSLMK